MIDRTKKIALITGGSGGIGSELCEKLAEKRIKILFTYFKNKKKADILVNKINKKGGSAVAFKMDISSLKSIKKTLNYFYKVEKKINILINNSGISQVKNFKKISENDWNKLLSTNLKGPFFLTQYFLKNLKSKNWGRIINISSISGIEGGYFQIHYAITKSGLISMVKSLNNIYGKKNFTFNAIAPKLIKTNMINKELKLKKKNKISLKNPSVVSKMVLKIISNKYKNKSGKIFIV